MRVLITGGTGFVGRHLLDVIASDSTSLTLDDVIVASRSPQETGREVETVTWDVTSDLVPNFRAEAVIHAATPASAELNARSPRLMFDQIVEGTRRVIEFCAKQPDPPRLVFTSSGAVYGEMPPDLTAWIEDSKLAADPLDAKNAYASGKRAAEALFALAGSEGVCRPTFARLFAFSGRHLPLNKHFALGNFVRDAVAGGPIRVRGTGTAVRSYLDGDDMATWLLLALLNEASVGKVIHVGSDQAITVAELARLVADRAGIDANAEERVVIEGRTTAIDGRDRYVPSTEFTRALLGVTAVTALSESIDGMLQRGRQTGSFRA
jgi:nucleoside-diphosphate-sugar epimerase